MKRVQASFRCTLRDILVSLFIGIIAFVFHSPFFRAAPGIMNSDFASFGILSDYMRKGHLQAFAFGQDYGGTWITALRALWQIAWFWFQAQTPESHLYSSSVYTYGFLPACLAIACYIFCRAYTGISASFLASLCVAVGFQFSTSYVYGSDFYLGCLLVGCLLMALRASFENPFCEMPKGKLLCAAVLTGFGLYTWRASLIYMVAFWVPWTKMISIFRKMFFSTNFFVRILNYFFWIFFTLALYLEIFERDLGTVFGKRIYLDAWPNWIGVECCLVLFMITYFVPRFKKEDWLRVAIVAFGVCIGFFPEIWQQFISSHPAPQSSPIKTHYFANMMTIWGHLPQSFKILMSGDSDKLSSLTSTILGIYAMGALVYSSHKQSKFIPMVWVAVLAIFEYARVRTYPDKSPLRYMTPLLPAVFLSIAIFFQVILEKIKYKVLLLSLAMILLSIHLLSQFQATIAWTQGILASRTIEHVWKTVDQFQKIGVQSVVTDSYWVTNQYTYFGEEHPSFISEVHEGMEPTNAESIFLHAKKVGYLTTLARFDALHKTIRGRTLNFHPLARVDEFFLYISD